MSDLDESTGYANSVDTYWHLGWRGVIPLEAGTKWPPPTGFTGYGGIDPSYPDVVEWKEDPKYRGGNLALRLADGQAGIDVDCHSGKSGAATLAEAENRWGPLPSTWTSTSRDDGSGILLYRIPSGVKLRDRIEFDLDDHKTGDIEVVQHHHRYVLAWPSFHDKTGEQYEWHGLNGAVVDQPPSPEDLPELPAAWVDGLRVEPTSADTAEIPADVMEFLTEGDMSTRVSKRLKEAIRDLNSSRHDSTRDHVLALLRFGKCGDPGVDTALKDLRKVFVAIVTPDRKGGEKEARSEFNRYITNARAAKLLAEPNKTEYQSDTGTVGPAQHSKPGEGTYTDTGNAATLVKACRDRFRYVEESGRWIGWDSKRWQVLPDAGRLEYEARVLAARIPVPQPVTVGDPCKLTDEEKAEDKARKDALAFQMRSLSQKGIGAAVRVAQADPDFHITQELLDTYAYELNTISGIVDLRTGNLSPHNKDSWHTKITAVGYDQKMKTPEWDKFLDTTFEGDAEIIAFVQRLAGYACVGEVTHHVLGFFHGELGNNGKSVVLNVLQGCLSDYAVVLPVSALVAGRNSHTEDTADLPGARLAICSEVGENTKWDEEKIKSLTGGDMLTARANYGHKFRFRPSHTIIIAANDRPVVETGGKSFFRRLRLVPFNHTVPDDAINEKLADELIDQEGAGILAWMVAGAVEVSARGLRPPVKVMEATGEYADTEDKVGQWIDECCLRVSPDFPTAGSELYRSYLGWCEDNGYEPKNSTAFGIALGRHGFPMKRTLSARQRMGIKLIEDPRSGQARFWEDKH